MSLIRRGREPLALEDVAQVTTAVGADDLRSRHTKGAVLMAGDGPRDAIKVCWPSTPRLELVVGLVNGSAAPGAGIDALLRIMLVELPGARSLSALLPQNTELLCW